MLFEYEPWQKKKNIWDFIWIEKIKMFCCEGVQMRCEILSRFYQIFS